MKHGLFMAVSLLSLAMSLASCSDDDQKFGLSLPEGTENTITLDYTNTLKPSSWMRIRIGMPQWFTPMRKMTDG